MILLGWGRQGERRKDAEKRQVNDQFNPLVPSGTGNCHAPTGISSSVFVPSRRWLEFVLHRSVQDRGRGGSEAVAGANIAGFRPPHVVVDSLIETAVGKMNCFPTLCRPYFFGENFSNV